MSYEQQTRQKPELPTQHYTVVHRLRNFDGSLLTAGHALFLGDLIERPGVTTIVSDDEGSLYVQSKARAVNGHELIHDSSIALWQGISRLALDYTEVDARIVPTAEIDYNRPIAITFGYLEDVTPEARVAFETAQTAPPEEKDVDLELEWLLSS